MVKNGLAFIAPEKSSSSEKVIVFDNEERRMEKKLFDYVLSRFSTRVSITFDKSMFNQLKQIFNKKLH